MRKTGMLAAAALVCALGLSACNNDDTPNPQGETAGGVATPPGEYQTPPAAPQPDAVNESLGVTGPVETQAPPPANPGEPLIDSGE